jgi:hypothetical protein
MRYREIPLRKERLQGWVERETRGRKASKESGIAKEAVGNRGKPERVKWFCLKFKKLY